MGKWAVLAAVLFAAAAGGEDQIIPSRAQAASPSASPQAVYRLRATRWSETDEREFAEFIAEMGESGCTSVDRCLRGVRNPYRGTDPDGFRFFADCADLPYYLRFYFAFKRGLPFSYVSEVEPQGSARDIRYTAEGNAVTARLYPEGRNAYEVLTDLNDAISSASYRIHPELEEPQQQDFYSPALTPKAIRPGTVIYDPNGHLAVVWKVEKNGRIRYMDAHPDGSVTRGFYDLRFVRASPGMGAGFKNWRPQILLGARKAEDGSLRGGTIVLSFNKVIGDFSLEQFFGNGPRPAAEKDWKRGTFLLNGEKLDYYDYVRGRMAGGMLAYDPLREVADMVDSNCADLRYRVDAVDLAVAAGLARQEQPQKLPPNIYATQGDWETYSTPSRDARLKTAFNYLRDTAKRFVEMDRSGDGTHLAYHGRNLPGDLLKAYDRATSTCSVSYRKSDGRVVALGFEAARARLFAMSFDPYHCPERRWGATDPAELASCPDGSDKRAWYEAEQNLRNQIDRSYDARMDFSLGDLAKPGIGRSHAPDTDLRTYLEQAVKQTKTE